jgi:hypothetical protein
MTPAERLSALRQRMSERSLDVYVVPSDDPHLSGKKKWQFLLFLNRDLSLFRKRLLVALLLILSTRASLEVFQWLPPCERPIGDVAHL